MVVVRPVIANDDVSIAWPTKLVVANPVIANCEPDCPLVVAEPFEVVCEPACPFAVAEPVTANVDVSIAWPFTVVDDNPIMVNCDPD